jgi:hypothetical protein
MLCFQVLKRQIHVYTASLPTVTLGDEFKGHAPPLQVCMKMYEA